MVKIGVGKKGNVCLSNSLKKKSGKKLIFDLNEFKLGLKITLNISGNPVLKNVKNTQMIKVNFVFLLKEEFCCR